MSEQANYFRLGLFLLVGTGILIAGVIVLGAGALFEKGPVFETYFDASVSGLETGAPVSLRGVTIGKVKRVGFVAEKYRPRDLEQEVRFGRWVFVEVELDPQTLPSMGQNQVDPNALQRRVEAGLRMRLVSSLTAPTSLQADYLDPNLYPFASLEWQPEYPYVPSAPSTMAAAMSAVERLAAQLQELDLPKILNNLNAMVLHADSAVVQVNDLLAGPEMVKIKTGLAETTVNAAAFSGRLRQTGARVDSLLASQSSELEAAIRSLRRAADNLAAATAEVRDNPSRLFGKPPPHLQPGE